MESKPSLDIDDPNSDVRITRLFKTALFRLAAYLLSYAIALSTLPAFAMEPSIALPELRLVNLVCACLINEPKFYQEADERKKDILALATTVARVEPEFILKLALYVRDDLNVRSTANFLAAIACNTPGCHPFLQKYFGILLRLPTDLLEMVDFFFAFPDAVRCLSSQSMPSLVRRAIKERFGQFDEYALGKYNRESAAKKKKSKKSKKAKANNVPIARVAFKHRGAAAPVMVVEPAVLLPNKKGKTTLKQLIRKIHIAAPAESVMAIVGKKYPASVEDFKRAGLSGAFDASRSGKRMKLPTPDTWETALSAMGNKAETWEALMDRKKLPFMAMLRNLRNLLLTGISESHHAAVLARLTDERSIASSRQLPWQFLSAYEAINLDVEQLLNDILDHDGRNEKVIRVCVKGRKGARMGAQRVIKKRVIIPKCVPDLPLIARYRAAIDTAVRLATQRNLSPIRGHSVVFVDVSGSMDAPCSTRSNGMGSLQSLKDVGIMLGLMLQSVCDSCDFRIFASASHRSNDRPDLAVPLSDEALLANVERVSRMAERLGIDTDFPVEYMEEVIEKRTHIDNLIIISDMMIAPGRRELLTRGRTVTSVLREYRERVNANMLFVALDLEGGAGRPLVSCEENGTNDVLVTGFSDHVLRYIAQRGNAKVLSYIRGIDASKGLLAVPPLAMAPAAIALPVQV